MSKGHTTPSNSGEYEKFKSQLPTQFLQGYMQEFRRYGISAAEIARFAFLRLRSIRGTITPQQELQLLIVERKILLAKKSYEIRLKYQGCDMIEAIVQRIAVLLFRVDEGLIESQEELVELSELLEIAEKKILERTKRHDEIYHSYSSAMLGGTPQTKIKTFKEP